MARKTFGDILKDLLGSKLDEEIDIEVDNESSDKKDNQVDNKESTKNETVENKETVKDNVTDKENTSENKDVDTENVENTEEKDMVNTKIFEDGWFDEASGSVNFDKIKNDEVLAALQVITGKYNAEKEARLISDSLNDTLKEYSLNVSEDTFRKVLDTSGVKIDKDGKVVGLKEAIEALKASEPTFFKDKEKESNPLNEGFNPVEKPTATTEEELINLAYCQ
jgi:hypothetical protein